MPPDELRRRVREAVESHIDGEAWTRALAVERAEKESIENFVGRWKAGRESAPIAEEDAAHAKLIEEIAERFGVSPADVKRCQEDKEADPALYSMLERCEKALAETYRKIRKKDKDSDISRRLVELGIAGLVTEKEAKEAMLLTRLPEEVLEAFADGEITRTEALRRAKRTAAHE